MTDIIVSPDPMLMAREYLARFYRNVHVQTPHGWEFKDLLVVVSDVGGSGNRSIALEDVLLTVEVSHPQIATASRVAREIAGLLREWPYVADGVYWRNMVGRPTFRPDDGTGVPEYILTVSMSFRKHRATVSER